MKKIILIGVVLLFIGTIGCYNDKYDQLYVSPATVTCDTTAVSFANDILPILNANCNIAGGCHDAAGQSTSGYNFTTYAGFQPVASYDYVVSDINWTPTRGHNDMPKTGSKISQCDINIITAWVDQGALNN